jgi:hypothetical protein
MAPRAAFFLALVLTGCFPPGEGLEPPSGRVYFPVGLAVDEEQKFLFIVNSDFDLQFNAGTVQSWDLTELRRRMRRHCTTNDDCACEDCDPEKTECDLVPREANGDVPSHCCVEPGGSPCGALRDQSDRSQALYPGRCTFINQMHPQDGGDPILPGTSVDAVIGKRSVVIGAFATDVIRRTLVTPGEPNRERLFIPGRGDSRLHWI